MGLDMYLYSYKEDGMRRAKDREHWIQWRKANAIHGWFVTHIQGGVDEWDEYTVPREKLVELMELCIAAHDAHWMESARLMPTMPGPFFGSTEYDEHYYWELQNTAKQLKALLSPAESGEMEFYYQATW